MPEIFLRAYLFIFIQDYNKNALTIKTEYHYYSDTLDIHYINLFAHRQVDAHYHTFMLMAGVCDIRIVIMVFPVFQVSPKAHSLISGLVACEGLVVESFTGPHRGHSMVAHERYHLAPYERNLWCMSAIDCRMSATNIENNTLSTIYVEGVLYISALQTHLNFTLWMGGFVLAPKTASGVRSKGGIQSWQR